MTAEVGGGDDDVQLAAGGVGAHPANGLASLFIACGQDEADVAESHAAIVNTTLLQDNSLHISVTIPSLIVATYGGGTGMVTQQECLAMLNCDGPGNVEQVRRDCRRGRGPAKSRSAPPSQPPTG